MKTMKLILTTVILCAFQVLSAQDGKEMIGQIYDYDEVGEFLYDDYEEEPTKVGDLAFAVVEYNGKYGIINKANEVVVPLIYDEVDNKNVDLFCVKMDGKYGWVDTKGQVVIECKYESVLYGFGGAAGFNDDEVVVKYKRKYGLINTKGEIVKKFKYVDAWEVPTTRRNK